jgi:hypothetical protein
MRTSSPGGLGFAQGSTGRCNSRFEHHVETAIQGKYVVVLPSFVRIHVSSLTVCVTESVRDMVRSENRFWNMSHDYYEGLADLNYGEKGGGPGKGASFVWITLSIRCAYT